MFYVVMRDRDDGDYDTVAAIQCDDDSLDLPSAEWALQIFEHCKEMHDGESFRIARMAVAEDVITQDTPPPCIASELDAMLNTAIFPSDANLTVKS